MKKYTGYVVGSHFVQYLEIIADELIASSDGIYNFYLNKTLIALYPIGKTIIKSIEVNE